MCGQKIVKQGGQRQMVIADCREKDEINHNNGSLLDRRGDR